MQDHHRQLPDKDSNTQAVKLTLNHVNFFYGNHQTLFKIDIEIIKNGVTSFIGPSGCGKSTLLRCLNRLNDLVEGARVEGTLLLDGMDIYGPGVDITDL
ncbi:MAG: ATP-binding cassette domain-containing protein, partial [Nitrospiraceae bacterium]